MKEDAVSIILKIFGVMCLMIAFTIAALYISHKITYSQFLLCSIINLGVVTSLAVSDIFLLKKR